MAKTYSQDQVQTAEENIAKKTDGRAIPAAAIALFVLLAIVFLVFAMGRNAKQAETSPEAIQNATVTGTSGANGGS